MAFLKDVGERNLIKNIRNIIRPSKDAIGTEDDAVVLKVNGSIVACTDLVTFERHRPDTMSYEQFGWTAAAVNFSDLAAMGATPIGLLASLALPENLDEEDLYDIMSGIDQCAEFCETTIVGGDTKPGAGIVSCTALGTMNGRTPMTRKGACVGDIVAVTGSLGSAAAGFYAVKNWIDLPASVLSLMTPEPRIEDGVLLSSSGAVTSCMDLSDGLSTAMNTICEQSRVGMTVEMEFLPEGDGVEEISGITGISKKELMMDWGGDYELMFTFKKDDIEKLYKTGVSFSIIGVVTNDNGAYLRNGDETSRLDYGKY